MTITQLEASIRIITTQPVRLSPQSITYLRTYPALLEAAEALPQRADLLLKVMATAAYGWMPRVARLDPDHFEEAVSAIEDALNTSQVGQDPSIIKRVSECLHSVVGASKLLHFLRPHIFPIWDSKVAGVCLGKEPSQQSMTNAGNYLYYAKEVEEFCAASENAGFFTNFGAAYSARLEKLRITPYSLTRVRAVEAAVFELAGGDYDAD